MLHVALAPSGQPGEPVEMRITKAGEVSYYHPDTGLLHCRVEDLPDEAHKKIRELAETFTEGFKNTLLEYVDEDALMVKLTLEQQAFMDEQQALMNFPDDDFYS